MLNPAPARRVSFSVHVKRLVILYLALLVAYSVVRIGLDLERTGWVIEETWKAQERRRVLIVVQSSLSFGVEALVSGTAPQAKSYTAGISPIVLHLAINGLVWVLAGVSFGGTFLGLARLAYPAMLAPITWGLVSGPVLQLPRPVLIPFLIIFVAQLLAFYCGAIIGSQARLQ